MKAFKTTALVAILVFAGGVNASEFNHERKQHNYNVQHDYFDYARVIRVRPIYREVQVSKPVRECWETPVYHTQRQHSNSAGGLLAGGIIGGIIGHQIGKGRGNKVATAVGTILGAQIGHEAVNGHESSNSVVEYQEHCKTRHQLSYEEVMDGYDVTYKYHGKRYQVEMPYDPGKRIKMRIQFTPVI